MNGRRLSASLYAVVISAGTSYPRLETTVSCPERDTETNNDNNNIIKRQHHEQQKRLTPLQLETRFWGQNYLDLV